MRKDIFKIYFCSIGFTILCFLISFFLPHVEEVFLLENKILNTLLNYDSEHYLKLAMIGYGEEHLYAFFPLYPLLIKSLAWIIQSHNIAGISISLICFTVSFFTLEKILKDSKNKNNILLCFGISPIICLSFSIYTEYTFLALTLLTYYYYKEDKYLQAGFFSGLTCMTRNLGFVFFAILCLDFLIQKRKEIFRSKNIKKLLLFMAPATILGSIYPLFLLFTTGDIMKFSSIQQTFWDRPFCFPWIPIINDIKNLILLKPQVLSITLNLVYIFIALFLGIKNFKKDKILSLFLILGTLIPLTTYTPSQDAIYTSSIVRYICGLFPFYVLLGDNNLNGRSKFYFYLPYFATAFICSVGFFMEIFIY